MSVPVVLRTNFTGLQLRALAKRTRDAAFARRLLALAESFDRGSRSDAARIGGAGLLTIRDWVLRFNAKGPESLKDGKAPGQPFGRAPAPDTASRDLQELTIDELQALIKNLNVQRAAAAKDVTPPGEGLVKDESDGAPPPADDTPPQPH